MNKNGKIYVLWIFLNTLYLCGTVLYINLNYERNYLNCFIIGIAILFGYYIFLSWIKNICRCLFWLMKKYEILICRLFPFCLDFSSGKLKIGLDRGLSDLGNVYTYPRLSKVNVEKYMQDSETIAKAEKYGHIALILISSCLIGIVKFEMAIIALTVGVSTFIFLNFESGIVFMGSLYDALGKGILKSESIYVATLEEFDKKVIYAKYSDLIIPSEKLSIRERRVIEGMFIDSIIERYDYINEQWLDAIFMIFSDENLRYMYIYNRLIFLFPLYCKIFKKEESNAKKLVERHVLNLNKSFPTWAFKKIKQLKKYDYHEILDYRNNSVVYRRKIEYIKGMGEQNEV